jgi:hypothetical protein
MKRLRCEQDDFSSNRHPALALCLRMSFFAKPLSTFAGHALTILLLMVAPAAAQTYPDRPIRLLVGFAAGGPADISARVLGDRFAEAWGQPVIVENITGAAGNIATERVAKAPPRRLHAAAGRFRHHRDQSEPLPEARIRSGE